MILTGDTYLEFDEIIVPLRAATNYTEDWKQVGGVEFRHTWNGRARVLGPCFKRKYEISISASGDGVWRRPELDGIQAGDTLTLHSRNWQPPVRIPADAASCYLSRTPVPGSVTVRSIDETVVPHTLDGRQVSIADPAGQILLVHWRAKVVCLVGEVGMTGDGAGGAGGWTLSLVEAEAPQ